MKTIIRIDNTITATVMINNHVSSITIYPKSNFAEVEYKCGEPDELQFGVYKHNCDDMLTAVCHTMKDDEMVYSNGGWMHCNADVWDRMCVQSYGEEGLVNNTIDGIICVVEGIIKVGEKMKKLERLEKLVAGMK